MFFGCSIKQQERDKSEGIWITFEEDLVFFLDRFQLFFLLLELFFLLSLSLFLSLFHSPFLSIPFTLVLCSLGVDFERKTLRLEKMWSYLLTNLIGLIPGLLMALRSSMIKFSSRRQFNCAGEPRFLFSGAGVGSFGLLLNFRVTVGLCSTESEASSRLSLSASAIFFFSSKSAIRVSSNSTFRSSKSLRAALCSLINSFSALSVYKMNKIEMKNI